MLRKNDQLGPQTQSNAGNRPRTRSGLPGCQKNAYRSPLVSGFITRMSAQQPREDRRHQKRRRATALGKHSLESLSNYEEWQET